MLSGTRRTVLIAVLALCLVQYVAVSNVGAGLYEIVFSDFTFGELHSYLPLPRGVVHHIHPFLRVITFPLSAFVASLNTPPRADWSRFPLSALVPFGDPKKNHVVLAGVNTCVWLIGGIGLVGVWRFLERHDARRGESHVR